MGLGNGPEFVIMVGRFLNFMTRFKGIVLNVLNLGVLCIGVFRGYFSLAQNSYDLGYWLNNNTLSWTGPTNGLWCGFSFNSNTPPVITIFVLSTNKPAAFDYVLPRRNQTYTMQIKTTNGIILASTGVIPPKRIDSGVLRHGDGLWIGNNIEYDFFPLGSNSPNQFEDIDVRSNYMAEREGDYIIKIQPFLYKFEPERKYLDRVDLPVVIKQVHLKPFR